MIDPNERELSFLCAAIYLATATLEGDEEKISDGVEMLSYGFRAVFTAEHVQSITEKVTREVDDAMSVSHLIERMAALKGKHVH